MLAGRILVHQKLVRIGGRLVVVSPKPVAHFGVKFCNGPKGIGGFSGSWRNRSNAAVGGDHQFVVRQRALLGGLAVQRCALLFGPRKLRGSGWALHCSGRGPGRCFHGRSGNGEHKAQHHKNRRKSGEALV